MNNKERCDNCGKWVLECSLVTLPEELYHLLDGDNEFSICIKCSNTKKEEYWKQWIPTKRITKEVK